MPRDSIGPDDGSGEYSIPLSLASVLGARKDGSAGVQSSRGLLMTVLGEFMLPHDGGAWTQTLVAAMELVGVRDKAARQALARMDERGWLHRERVGRQTRWTLTDHATGLLQAGAERIYGFARETRIWDGKWLLLLASVPERDRHVRYRMSLGLNWAGFGSIGQGIWISPWLRQEPVAVQLLGGLGVEATSFCAELGELGSGPALADQAWDLPQLRFQYEEFLADTVDLEDASITESAAAAALAGLVHRWRRFPFLDPELPAGVLPTDWPGPVATKRFAEMRAALLPAAHEWWSITEAHNTPAAKLSG